jgi:Tfp pilus assembly protein PilX
MWGLRCLGRLDLRAEEGITLVLALAILMLFSITTVTAVTMARSTQETAASSSSLQTASAIAEAGVNTAEAILNAPSANASLPTLLGCSVSTQNINNSAQPCTDLTVATASGTASFHGIYTQTGSSGTWAITSSGTVRNPNSAGNLVKTTTANVTITSGGSGTNISVWNYVYSTAPQGSGCEVDMTGNNVIVDVPIFVTGDLCFSANNSTIQQNTAQGGQAVDVRVLGKVVFAANNTSVGTSTTPITSGLASGGCTTTVNGTAHPCTTADRWYVSQSDSPITATPPPTDFPNWYLNASPGPKHVCDPTLTPLPNLTAATNKFDSNVTMDGTTPTFDLTGPSSYNCVTSSGTLSWNTATRLLTISGTIFFDGNVTSSDTSAMYRGKASLYVNGTFTLPSNNASLRAACPTAPATATHQCGWASASNEWNPNSDNLAIVASKASGTAVDFSGNNIQFQGGLMCPTTSTADFEGNNIILEGAIICGKFIWGQNMQVMPLPTVTNLPPGAPVTPNAAAIVSAPTYTS